MQFSSTQGMTTDAAERLLGSRFHLEVDRPVNDSVEVYSDGERWQVWRKK